MSSWRADTELSTQTTVGSEPLPGGRQRWREDAIGALLDSNDVDLLFVAGCEENQAKFHARFDHIVLLSAPLATLIERLDTRTNNPYGKSSEERQRVLDDLAGVEPLVRQIVSHKVGTTLPVNEVVTTILKLVDATNCAPAGEEAPDQPSEDIC